MIPTCLRDHILVVADRGYGVPRMLDILKELRCHYVLRIQKQTRLQLPDGRSCAVAELVSGPGDYYVVNPLSWTHR